MPIARVNGVYCPETDRGTPRVSRHSSPIEDPGFHALPIGELGAAVVSGRPAARSH